MIYVFTFECSRRHRNKSCVKRGTVSFYICLSYFHTVVSIILRENYVHHTIKSFLFCSTCVCRPLVTNNTIRWLTRGHQRDRELLQAGQDTAGWDCRSAVHSSQLVLQHCSVPLGLLLHHGSTEDMFEQLTQGHEGGTAAAENLRGWHIKGQTSGGEKIPVIYESERVSYNCTFNSDCSLWLTTPQTESKEAICKKFDWKHEKNTKMINRIWRYMTSMYHIAETSTKGCMLTSSPRSFPWSSELTVCSPLAAPLTELNS